MKRVSEKILITGLVMVCLAILTIILLSQQLSQKVHDTDVLISHTTEVQSHIQKMLSAAIDNETGARGFALTGDASFLEPLEKSEKILQENIFNLKSHSAYHPTQQARVDSLKMLLLKRMEHSRQLVTLRKEKGLNAAVKFAETGDGKSYTEQIRHIAESLIKKEGVLMETQHNANRAAIVYLNRVLFGLAIAIFFLLALVYTLVKKAITLQKKAQLSLIKTNSALDKDIKAKNEQLAHIFERITDAFAAIDSNWQFTYVNQKATEILNLPAEAMIGVNIWTIFPVTEESNKPFFDAFHNAMEKQKEGYLEEFYPPLNMWVEVRIYPSSDGISIFFGNITEKKKAAEKILKANRLYNFISEVNQMIVHTVNANTLFQNVCNIAIAQGQFKMAWIGLSNETTGNVEPVMFAGDEAGYLTEMKKIKTPDVAEGRGPTGTAIRQGKYVISNDIEHDEHMQPWKVAALARGYRSSIAVPVFKFGKVIGSFNVYAAEKDFFDAEEVALLQEAASDISFALEVIEKERQRELSDYLLKEERDRFVKIAETSPGLIYSFKRSPEGASFSFPYAGKAIEDIFGYTKQELEKDAMIIVQHFHPDDSKRIAESIDVSAQNLTPWKCEFRYNHPNKGEIWLEGHTIPKKETDGSTVWYGLIIDTTIRKKAEQELENSNIRFELITRSTNDALWEWNFETGLLWGNEIHQALYGLTMADQVPGNDQWIQRIHPDDRMAIANTQNRSLSSQKNNFISEYRFLNSKNEYRHIYDRCYILRNRNGEPVRMVGSMMDITDQKKAEMQITKEKEFSDIIINSLPGIFYLIDEKGKLLRWNNNLQILSGYTQEELLSVNALDFFDNGEKEFIAAAIQTAVKTGTTEVEAHFYTKEHKKIPFYFNGFSFQFNNQKCIVGVGIDIYERKAAEAVIKQINKELHDLSAHLQTVREEERLQISRDIHDELGQQLTGLKLGIEWLSLKISDDEGTIRNKVIEMIELIKVTIQSVRRISSNLRPSMLDDLDLVAALEWQSIEMKNRYGINITFNTNLTASDLSLETSTALFRIYQEALTNVVRHSGASEVNSRLQKMDNEIILTISDNGIGMDLTVKKEHNSFGIIGIKERTFAIGGQFELISRPGEGTTIKIVVPV